METISTFGPKVASIDDPNGNGDGKPTRVYIRLRLGPDPLNTLTGRETVNHETLDTEPDTVSITYEEWRIHPTTGTRLGRDSIAGGAGVPERIRELAEAGVEVPSTVARIAEIADRWHLNGMRAGCAHQPVVYETDRYGRRAPSLDLTPACPITGYRYGHAWLVETIPADVLAELRGYIGSKVTA